MHGIDPATLREEARLASSGEETSGPSFRLDPHKTRRTVSNCITNYQCQSKYQYHAWESPGLVLAGVWFLITLNFRLHRTSQVLAGFILKSFPFVRPSYVLLVTDFVF